MTAVITSTGPDGHETPDADEGRRALELDQAHVFHSWSAQAGRSPLAIAGGLGSHVWDYQGRRYLDFSSQLVNTNIGHQHPRVVAAIQEQAAKLCTVAPQHANAARSEVAAMVCGLTPAGLDHVFFTNAGAEAVEHAVRMARLHTGRIKVLAQYRSYHGGTQTAVNLTGDPRRWANDYGSAGAVHFFGPFLYRSPFHSSTEEQECSRALEHLEEVIAFEGPATIAAVILETIPGTAGIMPPPPGYLAGVRELCDRHGIMYIADEVMAGFGRTGRWFAYDHYDVTPDLVTFAKGINSGYVPLGALTVRQHVYEAIKDRFFAGGLTYSGHPLACAAAVASIEAFREEGVVENSAAMGEVLREELPKLQERHRSIGDVRGLGLFWGLELVRSRETREPLVPYNAGGDAAAPVTRMTKAALERGLYLFVHWNVVMIAPPLTITRDELDEGLAVLDDVLSIADEYYAD